MSLGSWGFLFVVMHVSCILPCYCGRLSCCIEFCYVGVNAGWALAHSVSSFVLSVSDRVVRTYVNPFEEHSCCSSTHGQVCVNHRVRHYVLNGHVEWPTLLVPRNRRVFPFTRHSQLWVEYEALRAILCRWGGVNVTRKS